MKFGFRELVFVTLMLGLLGSAYLFWFKATNEKQQRLRADTQTKQRELNDLRQATAGIADIDRKNADLRKAIDFFNSKLPKEKEMDKILNEVWQKAEANNLQVKTVKTLKTERTAQYTEQPIHTTLIGSWDGFYEFLQQVEKLPRLTRLNTMNLQKLPAKDGEIQAQITLSIFFEGNPGDAPASSK